MKIVSNSKADHGKETRFFASIGLILSVLAFLSYWWAVLRYAVNAPFWDDYEVFLHFLNQFQSSKGLLYRIHLLFSQDLEHRVVFPRAVALLDYAVFGKIDFVHLTVIGNLGLVFIVLLLCVYLAKRGVKPLNLAVVVVTMCSFSLYEDMLWASASLQQYYELFFSLAAIFFFTRSGSTGDLIAGLLLSTIASFTQAGGLILFPVMLVYFIISKDLKKGLAISVYGALVFYVFFVLLHYHQLPIDVASRMYALHHPSTYLLYVVIFLGNLIPGGHPTALWIPCAAGTLLLILAIQVIIRYVRQKREPFLFCSMLFILATAAAVGLDRVGWGIKEATVSRYSVYPLLLLVIIFGYYLTTYRENRAIFARLNLLGTIVPLVVFALWFNRAFYYLNYMGLISYHYVAYLSPNTTPYAQILSESERLHVFVPGHIIIPTTNYGDLPNTPLPASVDMVSSLPRRDYRTAFGIDSINGFMVPSRNQDGAIVLHTDRIAVQGWAIDERAHAIASAVFADVNGSLYPLTYGIVRPDVAEAFKSPDYVYAGFQGSIPAPGLRKGENTLSFRIIDFKETGYYQTKPIKIWFSRR